MKDTLLIGKYIYKILSEDENLAKFVSKEKIFPLMAKVQINPETGSEEDISFPFVVYSRESFVPRYTKNFLTENDAKFSFVCVSDEYVNSLELANALRHALEGKSIKNENLSTDKIKLDSVDEDIVEDAYIQKLTFSFSIT